MIIARKGDKEKRPEVALHMTVLALLLSRSEKLPSSLQRTTSSNDLIITEPTGQCLAVTSSREI